MGPRGRGSRAEKNKYPRKKTDTEEEDILPIYINFINMVNAFSNLQIDFIFSVRNYCKTKSYRNILLLQTNDK